MSKESILAAIARNTCLTFERPTWRVNTVKYADELAEFVKNSAVAGGEAVELPQGQTLEQLLAQHYAGVKLVSNLPELSAVAMNPDQVERAQDLNGTDVAVVKGEIGVAENGCVWIVQSVKHRMLYFIAERLVIVLDKRNVVSTMADAYERIAQLPPYGFGTFISGPSKTADIEQALVKGAHGACEVLVVLV